MLPSCNHVCCWSLSTETFSFWVYNIFQAFLMSSSQSSCVFIYITSYNFKKVIYNINFITWYKLKTCGATQNPEFPKTGPDRTGPKPVRGRGTFLRIFSGRVGEYYFGSVRVGVFFTRVWDIFSRDFGDKLAFHSQTEEVEWLLSLISTFTVKTVFRD